ncbi:MAG TPA: alpha/beta fold hydrolase [Novosphingobium sp.]|nr:alpha/beta fold hydrolase [Novosphingobium sp.]
MKIDTDINRRELARTLGMGALGAGALGAGLMATTGQAAARPAAKPAAMPVPQPPGGPWTGYGNLRRAGGVLHYATLGPDNTGLPPVVVLHKLGGWLSDWRFVAPALAEHRKVIAIDLPGHGGSRWDGEAPYIQTLGETAALLVGLLDELDIMQVDLLGTSLGGCAAAVLAAHYPERIHRLSIISSALYGRRTLAQVKAAVDDKLKAIFDDQGNPLPTPPQLLVDTFGMVHPEAMNEEGILSRRAAAHWLQPSERGVGVCDLRDALRRIEAPTLMVFGEHDKAYVKFRTFAEAALRHSRTEVVPDSGAFVIQDNPTAAAAILKRFVEQG